MKDTYKDKSEMEQGIMDVVTSFMIKHKVNSISITVEADSKKMHTGAGVIHAEIDNASITTRMKH